MYLVVLFEPDETALIPENWLLDSRQAYWPQFKNSQTLTKAVREKWAPQPHWQKYAIKELYRNADYERARRKLTESTEKSDLATTTDVGSDQEELPRPKRTKRSKFPHTSSEDEENEPPGYTNSQHSPVRLARQSIRSDSQRSPVTLALQMNQSARGDGNHYPVPPSTPSAPFMPGRSRHATVGQTNDGNHYPVPPSTSSALSMPGRSRHATAGQTDDGNHYPVPPSTPSALFMPGRSRYATAGQTDDGNHYPVPPSTPSALFMPGRSRHATAGQTDDGNHFYPVRSSTPMQERRRPAMARQTNDDYHYNPGPQSTPYEAAPGPSNADLQREIHRLESNVIAGHGRLEANLIAGHGRLFAVIEQQQQEIMQLRKELQQFMRASRTLDPEAAALPEGLTFPLTCKDDMENLERMLGEKAVELSVINHLSVVGGGTTKEATYNLLKSLLSSQLAETYSWTGVGGKTSFSVLRLKDIVFRVVRRNRATREATNEEIKKAAQEWFRSAPDRNGGRKRRMERARGRVELRENDEGLL